MKIYEYETKTGQKKYGINSYLGVDTTTGKQVNFNRKGFKSKAAVKMAYKQALVKFETGELKATSVNYTFEEVYRLWLETYELGVYTNSALNTRSIFNSVILPNIGHYKIKSITPQQLQHLVNQWHATYKSYRVFFSKLKRIFQYAKKMEFIVKNPTEKVDIPRKRIEEEKIKFYTKEELGNFLYCLQSNGKEFWFVFFRLLAYSGLRKGEALALTWEDIDFEDGKITIDKTLAVDKGEDTIHHSAKTAAGNRTIILDDETIKILKKWETSQIESCFKLGITRKKYIFSRMFENYPIHLNSPYKFYKNFCKKYNLKYITVHGFRHTHCTLLFEAGVSIPDVKDRLGHKDIKMTMNIYNHVTEKKQQHVIDLFSTYMSSNG